MLLPDDGGVEEPELAAPALWGLGVIWSSREVACDERETCCGVSAGEMESGDGATDRATPPSVGLATAEEGATGCSAQAAMPAAAPLPSSSSCAAVAASLTPTRTDSGRCSASCRRCCNSCVRLAWHTRHVLQDLGRPHKALYMRLYEPERQNQKEKT